MPEVEENFVKIPYQAWAVINGEEYEVNAFNAIFRQDLCQLQLALSNGRGFGDDVVQQLTEAQLATFEQDVPVQLYVSSNEELPGLPSAERELFYNGYLLDVSPAQVSGRRDTYTIGVLAGHKGISDLSIGSTSSYPFSTNANFDWSAPAGTSEFDRATLSRMLGRNYVRIVKEGLWPTFDAYFQLIASGGEGVTTTFARLLSSRQVCDRSLAPNQVAIDALGAITASPLAPLDFGTLSGQSVVRDLILYIDNVLNQDMRTMPFYQQILTLGEQLMFRIVPHANGTLEVIPFTPISEPYLTIDASEVFKFVPHNVVNNRVAGVVFIANGPEILTAFDDNRKIVGCYTFDGSTQNPRGIIVTEPGPPWLSSDTQLQAGGRVRSQAGEVREAADPGRLEPDDTTLEDEEDPIARGVEMTETFGVRLARDRARMLRYGSNRAEIQTYLRKDIGLHSTLEVIAQGADGGDVPIYGKVESIELELDSNRKAAMTRITLAYTRNHAVQSTITDFGHPIYSDEWNGSPL